MAKVYHQIVNLTNKPPSLRADHELEQLVPWFRKKSSNLFEVLEDDKIKKLLKEADFRRYRCDDVIIRQGDVGDEFFILISGSISFHVVSNDDLETMVCKQKQEEISAKEQGRSVNPEYYGTQVGTGTDGKTFGELALIYPDCIRNATVISNNVCSDVLVVSKDLYNETLSGFQSREFAAKEKFVSECPLFQKWSPKYRKMAAMSVEKIVLKFEDVVVKQGSPVNGLHFLVRGQVNIRVDPGLHRVQFPHQFPEGDIADLERGKARERLRKEMNLQRHRSAGKKFSYERRSTHSEASRKTTHRLLELCLMGAMDTIGDLEMVMNLPSYSQSIVCTETAILYHLDQRNYVRLVERKNPQTLDMMRDIVHTKLALHFSRLPEDSIPMYRYMLYLLEERKREQQQQRQQQIARDRSTLTPPTATTKAHWQIDNLLKGPLVDLHGPGSVFFWIHHRVKEQQQRKMRATAAASNTKPVFRTGSRPNPSSLFRQADDTAVQYSDDASSVHDDHINRLNDLKKKTNELLEKDETDDDGEGAEANVIASQKSMDSAKDNETALFNLEQRLMRWHGNINRLSASKNSSTAVLSTITDTFSSSMTPSTTAQPEEHCVDENKPRPGLKIYVRAREEREELFSIAQTTDNNPIHDEDKRCTGTIKALVLESDVKPNTAVYKEDCKWPPVQRQANKFLSVRTPGVPDVLKKVRRRRQYTMEDYKLLKEELRRRQRAYKSFLPQRANTTMF